MSFRVLQAAIEDADRAAAWYDSRRPGLGAEFLGEIEQAFHRIRENSLAFPQLEYPTECGEHVRHALLKSFPYTVIFVIYEELTTVIAVEHTSRQPGRWAERLDENT